MNSNNNNTHPEPNADAALYALGALSKAEAEEIERRIADGEEIEGLREDLEVVAALGEELAAAMPAPRRALKNSILAGAMGNADRHSQIIVHAEQGRWIDIGLPGIRIKILYQDPETKRTTLLAKIEPGAVYPQHRHNGLEELFVVEGDLQVDGTMLRAGDYTASTAGSVHHSTHSPSGCIALITSSMSDEFFEDEQI